MKQKKFAQQRSILKTSQEYSTEDLELLEAKKQMILRRRRLFSHYRQYEQWRRRQFSYDPSYYRPNPLPIGQAACSDYQYAAAGAYRRRRQYRRQYSCVDRSRESSHESRGSSSLKKFHSMINNDTDSSTINHTHPTERISFDSSECGALAYQSLHCKNREEHSSTIAERCTRSRINSAIFVSSEGRGFDSIEFLRRHGSQSVLCRKARSAENITDNARKKSFSDKRNWRTDEVNEDSINADSNSQEAIEMKECRPNIGEARTLPVLKANGEASMTASTANIVVGSISIEAPPAYMKDDIQTTSHTELHAIIASTNYASHDSTDTVEELILVPTETKARVLVHQHSSTASSSNNRSQSPALSSAHSSPKARNLKEVRPLLGALPMVSVSGPTPPDEKPPPTECL